MEVTSSMVVNEEDDLMDLPPGFRFHPTDEEIITHYLTNKVIDQRFTALAIGEVDMNKCEPWDLPKKAKMKEKEWFFFCQRDRKYPTGMRTNRATGTGYWKATGKDREIYKVKGCLIGMKKTLVFYKGRAPKGEKTNWVMHEYRLEGRISYYNFPRGTKDEWVVCKIYHKSTSGFRDAFAEFARNDSSFMEEILGSPSSLPPLMDDIDKPSTSSFTHEEQYELFMKGGSSYSSSPQKSTNNNAILSSSNSYYLQENQINNFFIPTNTYPFKASYQALNPIQENPNYFHYPNSSAANQQLSSNNNSMVSPISQDTTAEINSSNKDVGKREGFEDIEGLSYNSHNNMSELESLWDY